MPIYEFACPKCRTVFSFLSKRINPERLPVCPKCGSKKMIKEMSNFALTRGGSESGAGEAAGAEGAMPPGNDPRLVRAMNEMERDLPHLDENNPKHLAQMMRKMQNLMPPGTMPKDMATAIRRLEAGEDPEKIEADMGDLFGEDRKGPESGGGTGGYSRAEGLYDY